MTDTKQHSDLIEKLTDGIERLATSDEWVRYLDYQSRFHNYSFNNVLLIAAQCEHATMVAGFHSWRKMARFVRKGEKSIRILAPMVYKNDDADASDDRVIRGFKWVSVFDVSQTDGEDLPTVCSLLDGDDVSGAYGRLLAFARGAGFQVEDATFADTRNGDCSHHLHRIRVAADRSESQRVKTLAHEIAHALLHESFDSRAQAELEAESVAYVVCATLGINSDDYSFGYVTTWAGGGDEARDAVKAAGARIQKTAEQILTTFQHDAEEAA